MVESAGLYKVVPEADAKLQSGAVTVSDEAIGGALGNQIVDADLQAQLSRSANNLVPVLRPLISPNNTINVNPGTNSLVITDYADNLRRLARIIAADGRVQRHRRRDVAAQARHGGRPGTAGAAADRVARRAAAAPGQADTSFKTTLVAEPRSNALILRAANPARVALVKSLVEKLDQPVSAWPNGDGGQHLCGVPQECRRRQTGRHACAPPCGEPRRTAARRRRQHRPCAGCGARPAVAAASAQSSTGGQIQADPATNSLIITAPEPQYRQLRAVIDQLDGRRAQVLVESLIAEVNADKAAEFGIQWQGPLGKAGDAVIGLLGTNFGAGGNNIINAGHRCRRRGAGRRPQFWRWLSAPTGSMCSASWRAFWRPAATAISCPRPIC